MFLPRWYATATLLPDGNVMVTGHDQQPFENADLFRDIYDVDANTWLASPTVGGAWPNWVESAVCNEVTELPMQDYPRVHVLRTGWAMQTNATIGPAATPDNMPSRFLDLVNPETCSAGEPRWSEGDLPSTQRVNGTSVHLITWTPGVNDDFTEVVYVIGGGTEAHEAALDCQGAPPSDFLATSEKMVEPSATSLWEPAPTMAFSRNQQNTVILLDGSLLTVGGQAVDTPGTCEARRIAERYRTYEVFGNPNAGWVPVAAQSVDRRYHSVAALLPDGRVLSAGGQVAFGSTESEHTVEVYSPPYFFLGPRPVIETDLNEPHDFPYSYGEELDFQVSFSIPGKSVRRVALLRNAASTHAFDMNQRYVELEQVFANPTDEDPNLWDVRVRIPTIDPSSGATSAPEGFYMLTVVDSDNIPAAAEWIRIENSGP